MPFYFRFIKKINACPSLLTCRTFDRYHISSALAQTVTRQGGDNPVSAMKNGRGVSVGIDDTSGHHPAAAAAGDGHHHRLDLLHESLLAKQEQSLLPLYPPGDIFLACTASTRINTASTCAKRDQGEAGGIMTERKAKGGNRIESAHPAPNRYPDGGSTSIRNNPDVGGSGIDIGDIIMRSGRRGSSDGCVRLPSSKVRSPAGEGGEIRSDEEWVLVRVPQLHFLHMTLSPTMLTDHAMDSYKRAIAELKKRFRPNPTRDGAY